MSPADPPVAPDQHSDDVPEQFRIRQGKRQQLLDSGREAYPVSVPRTHSLAQVRAAYPDLPADTVTGDVVGVTGRVVFARNSDGQRPRLKSAR